MSPIRRYMSVASVIRYSVSLENLSTAVVRYIEYTEHPNDHLRDMHKLVYACEQCGKVLSTWYELNKHRLRLTNSTGTGDR